MDNWACPIMDSRGRATSVGSKQGLLDQSIDIEFAGNLEFGRRLTHGGWAFLALRLFSGISSNGLLDKNRLDVWQDENGYLDSCISFEWRLESLDEELDLRSWNHTGLSFLLVV